MTEQELKRKANALRHEIEAKNSRLSELYAQLKTHHQDTRSLRRLRDSLNEDVKEHSKKLKEYKEKRDKLNKAVAELSMSKRQFIVEVRKLNRGIKDSKGMRDMLNKSVRSTEQLLEHVLEDKLNVLLEEDISLADEQRLYDVVLNLSQRLESARKASQVHKKIVEDFKNLKEVSSRIDSVGSQLSDLSVIADEYHKKVVETYDHIKKKNEEASEAHRKLTEKYKDADPIRAHIGAVKEEIKKIQDELSPISDALEDIRAQREEKRKLELTHGARERLKKSKRVSLDDLKIILEHGPLDAVDTPP